MKKKIWLWVIVSVLLAFVLPCAAAAATPVAANGALSVKGAQIVNSRGETFQIKGVSTHGLSWYPEYVSSEAFRDLRDNWGVNTVRLAMYTAEYNGYCVGDSANRKKLKELIDTGVKAADALGMYVIIDWHILSDGNPAQYEKQAVAFFREMAEKYKDCQNVLYEICNEPNGGVSWQQIRSYAQEVIGTIRAYDRDAVIIVGTPNWSQDVDEAAKDPLEGENLVYALHFYADTHRDAYRAKARKALQAGLPLLVSEFSICDASGNGGINKTEAETWMTLLNKYGVGYVAWNLSNKNETSALLKSSCSRKSGWKASDLSETGKWLVKTTGGKLSQSTAASGEDSGKKTQGQKKSGKTQTASSKKAVKASAKYCTASVKKVNSWKSGNRYYTHYTVTLKGKGKRNISGWKLRVNFKSAIKKSQAWCGKYSYKKKYLTISPLSWNKKLSAKGKLSDIGFIVSSSAKNNKIKSVKFL